MARKPMVTRKIITTRVNVLCLNVTTGEPFNKVVSIPRTYKDDKALMKKVQEVVDTDEVKAVNIDDKEELEILYGMDEQLFIERATILDPETRKPVDEADETAEQAKGTEN